MSVSIDGAGSLIGVDQGLNIVGLTTLTGGIILDDSISHIGDADTKIRFPAADTFTVETAGSEALRIDSSGRLLLGTTTEGQAFADDLTVATSSNTGITIRSGSSEVGSIYFSDDTSGPGEYDGFIQYNHSTRLLQLGSAAETRLRIDSSGNVAIGTATAGGTLHVENSGELNAFFEGKASTLGARILLKNNDNTANAYNDIEGADAGGQGTSAIRFINVNDGNNEGALALRTRASGGSMAEALRIDSSGRLLIGETSAVLDSSNALLQIGATDGANLVLYRDNTPVNNDSSLGLIRFYSNAGSSKQEHARISGLGDGTSGADDKPGRLVFYTTADGNPSPTERLRIDSNGKTGINISNPGSYNSSGNELVLGNTGSNAGMTIVSNSSNNGHIFFADGTASGAQNRGIIKYEHGNDAMAFNTAETERMRIHSGGVVSFSNGIELGSGLDATAANTLEDYEEGTFTPTANSFTVSGTTTMTGKYVKIGQQVTIGIKFANTGTIAYSTSCNIANLPFTMASGTEAHGLIGMLQNSNSKSFDSNQSGTQCKLDGEGGSRFFVGNFTTTSSGEQLIFGGTYISNQ